MKKIIGIIPSTLGFDSNNPFDKKYYVQNSYIEKVIKIGGIPIIIPPNNLRIIKETLDLCDSFIIIGGKNVHSYHFEVIDYALKTNKKILGICLGMQVLGMYSNKDYNEDTLIEINNHNKKTHYIYTKENTLLRNVLGNKIKVNSFHNYSLKYVTPPFKISATYKDVIEGIEYKNFIGVQFHPELLDHTYKLFKWLIE